MQFLRKIGVLLVGIPVVIIGIILMPLPGPGILIVLAGLFIISLEFEWAKRLIAWIKERTEKVLKKAKPSQPSSTPTKSTTKKQSVTADQSDHLR